MKKIISIVLALSMMLTLCACGKSDEAKHADETIAAIGTVTTNSLSQIERAEKEVENLSDKDVLYKYDEISLKYDGLLISNYDVQVHEDITEISLKPYEARLYKI